MGISVLQPSGKSPSFPALLFYSRSLQNILAAIASRCGCVDAQPKDGSLSLHYTCWESALMHALSVSLADLLAPHWMATLLPEFSAQKLCVRPLAGLPAPTVSDFPLTPDFQNRLVETERRKNRIFWWDLAGADDPSPFTIDETRAVCGIPFFADSGDVEIILAMGFQRLVQKENPDWQEPLRAASEHLQGALSTYRRIIRGAPAVHIETNCACANAAWGTGFATNPTTLVAVGVQPRSENCCGPYIKDYCAVAALETGCTRLLTVRPVSSGTMRLWECAVCDGVFRAACALGASPAETVEWINSAGSASGEMLRRVRLVCCADVSESGRDYVFSGTCTHLLYENGSQTVNEVYERFGDGAPQSGPRIGQRSQLRSGDILILHTFELPAKLCHRHDVLRRLAMLLACEGRRPMADLVPKVVSLLNVSESGGTSSESSLIMLRAE